MTKLCVVRHGETDWNALGRLQGRTDIPLNQLGIQQAKECGDFLKGSQWDLIITSPLKRAKHTAEIINQSLNLPLEVMNEFAERSFGDAEGMNWEEIKAAFPDGIYPNKEEKVDLTKRVLAGLAGINEKFKDKKIILVAHGAVINSILFALSNGELGNEKTSLVNACITNIHFHEKQWMVKDYNLISHLSMYK